METDEIKAEVMAVNELIEDYSDLLSSLRGTIKETKTAQKLWRAGDKSRLIKLGIALIIFPEPTPISETIGSVLVAAGLFKSAMQRRTLYTEDIFKTLRCTVREISKGKPNHIISHQI